MALTFAKPRLITFDGMSVSDHNRSPLSIDIERIETAVRMANGTRRAYHVADKKTFSVSWSTLPNIDRFTVDGYAGADTLHSFYSSHKGAFTLMLFYGQDQVESFSVAFTDFSRSLTKRGHKFDIYDVDLTMEEI